MLFGGRDALEGVVDFFAVTDHVGDVRREAVDVSVDEGDFLAKIGDLACELDAEPAVSSLVARSADAFTRCRSISPISLSVGFLAMGAA